MKILHVSPSYFPAFKFGGPIQSVHLLNTELAKNLIEVDVYTTNAGLQTDKTIIPNSWSLLNEVRVKYFSFLGYEHFNFSVKMLIALYKNLPKYDMVHITAVWNFPVLAASWLCWWHKIPYIISPRGTIYSETIAIKSSTFKKIYLKLFAERFLHNASAIHYTSQDEKDQVESYLGLVNGFVIANGISFNQFEMPKIQSSIVDTYPTPYILFLGRINKKKGLDILFEGFAKLLIVHPNIHLIIAGHDNDGYKAELDILARELKISANIIFAGPILGDEKTKLYKNALFFVLTSYSENFGMSVVEAMACTCPVLISDKVGIADTIQGNNAGLIVKTNPPSIYNGLIQLVEKIELRTEFAQNGYQTVQKLYSIDNVAKEFIIVYKKLSKANGDSLSA